MESVVFEGKEYIKASVLAEKFRYTQDYLGQLCRGKKVDARLVGRAWYVNLASLEDHRSNKYKTTVKDTKASEISIKKNSNNYLSRIDVEPVLKNKTVKIFREKNGQLTETAVRYEKDEYSLIPKVNKSAVSVAIPIIPAEAEKIKVTNPERKFNVTSFKAEALPEVYLSGHIKVDGLPEPIEPEKLTSDEEDSSDISSKFKVEQNNKTQRIVSIRPLKRRSDVQEVVDVKRIVQIKKRPVLIKEKHKTADIVTLESAPPRSFDVKAGGNHALENHAIPVKNFKEHEIVKKTTFSPKVVSAKKASAGEKGEDERSFQWIGLFLLLFAFVVAVFILVTVREMTVHDGLYTDRLTLDFHILRTFFEILFK